MAPLPAIKLGVISNPHALKNERARSLASSLRTALNGCGPFLETAEVDAIPSALRVLDEAGVKLIVVHGGDGALHWVLNAAVDVFGLERATSEFIFAPSSGGTINFLAHALGWPNNPRANADSAREAAASGAPKVATLPSLHVELYREGEETPEVRYAYASALAGYAANFYEPFYRTKRFAGPVRIVGLLAEAFGAATLGSVFQGPLASLKPNAIAQREHDYLRPMFGDVLLDGELARAQIDDGVRAYNLVQAGSVHVDLGGVIKVFGEANPSAFHAHVGYLSAAATFPALLRVARSQPISDPRVYDGPTESLDVRPRAGETIVPCLDGELFEGVTRARLSTGPAFRFLAPSR